jgi:hypothetical protein
MKKLMTLMLGLSLVMGATSLFADDAKSTKKEKKAKKTKAKKTDEKK